MITSLIVYGYNNVDELEKKIYNIEKIYVFYNLIFDKKFKNKKRH